MPTAFDALALRPALLEALDRVGFTEMTPIQAAALPLLLEGFDVRGQAMTGSGKTAAFGLALLNVIEPGQRLPQALVLCPTRELAEQVAEALRQLAQGLANTRVLTLCGGRSSRPQRRALEGGCDVVVGTPGRVLKHLHDGALLLSELRVLVLDEADRMLDMGFIEQVEDVVACCPPRRQTLLFSATFPDRIETLSRGVQRDARSVATERQVEPALLRQIAFRCSPRERHEVIAQVLSEVRPSSALLFCETKADCDALADALNHRGATAMALHGDLDQRDRDDVLIQFSNGSASLLVATNVAARGLDIPALPMVLIAELSPDPQSHVHRVGRTGRAGEPGLAVSVVASATEEARLERIEAELGQPIQRGTSPQGDGDLRFLTPPNQTLLIFSGRRDKLRKGDVMGALVKDVGLPPEAVGRIDLMPGACAVAVARPYAKQALRALKSGRVKKKRVRARLLGETRG